MAFTTLNFSGPLDGEFAGCFTSGTFTATITKNSDGSVSGTWTYVGSYTDIYAPQATGNVSLSGTIVTAFTGSNYWDLDFLSPDPHVSINSGNSNEGFLDYNSVDGKYYLRSGISFDVDYINNFGFPRTDTFSFGGDLAQYILPPVISIDQYPGYISEDGSGGQNYSITLKRSGANLNVQSTVTIKISDGLATLGNDFTIFGGGSGDTLVVTFPPNITSVTVPFVTIINDTIIENNENFHIDLVSPVNATIGFGTGDTVIMDNDGGPIVFNGGNGNDTVTGRSGNDTFSGGGGNDILNGGEGDDTLNGDAGTDKLFGGLGKDVIDGGAGVDTLAGGGGDDTYKVDLVVTNGVAKLEDVITENINEGVDTLILRTAGDLGLVKPSTIVAPNGIEVLDASQTGSNKLNLVGNSLDNTIIGNDGDNTLDGGMGVDTMIGGAGNDIFIVDNILDVVVGFQPGRDTIIYTFKNASTTAPILLSINNIPQAEIENATVTGTGLFNIEGNTNDNVLTGNASINSLAGGDGNDSLDGMGGADAMDGGDGDDTYYVDNVGDQIADSSGNDTAIAKMTSGTFVLADGLENLGLGGTSGIHGTGNAAANSLTGNSGANILNGAGGADSMAGGLGNDIYFVDDAGDVASENPAAGSDTVKSSVDFTLGDNIEILLLLAGATTGTGNAGANTITGNAGDNVLDGAGGVDKLSGLLGNDTYIVDLINAAGVAKLQDSVTESTGQGIDTLRLRTGGDLGLIKATTLTLNTNFENFDISLTGTNKLNIKGTTAANVLIGNDGDNTVDGAAGADSMQGGLGNDIYLVDNAGDAVSDTGGIDTVNSAITLDISGFAGIDNLLLTGTTGIGGTGSADANVITGNSVANALNGGAGSDTLLGLGGNDNLQGGLDNDILDGGAGIDSMTGGSGSDIFVFHAAQAGTATNADVIADFTAGAGGDALDIHDILIGYTPGNIAAFVQVVNDGFGNSIVSIDKNGATSGASFIKVATLTGVTGLDAATMLADQNLIVS